MPLPLSIWSSKTHKGHFGDHLEQKLDEGQRGENYLDELVNADRVVPVPVHQGERLVAFLNSVHLLPVFVSLVTSAFLSINTFVFLRKCFPPLT